MQALFCNPTLLVIRDFKSRDLSVIREEGCGAIGKSEVGVQALHTTSVRVMGNCPPSFPYLPCSLVLRVSHSPTKGCYNEEYVTKDDYPVRAGRLEIDDRYLSIDMLNALLA